MCSWEKQTNKTKHLKGFGLYFFLPFFSRPGYCKESFYTGCDRSHWCAASHASHILINNFNNSTVSCKKIQKNIILSKVLFVDVPKRDFYNFLLVNILQNYFMVFISHLSPLVLCGMCMFMYVQTCPTMYTCVWRPLSGCQVSSWTDFQIIFWYGDPHSTRNWLIPQHCLVSVLQRCSYPGLSTAGIRGILGRCQDPNSGPLSQLSSFILWHFYYYFACTIISEHHLCS